MNVVIPFQRAPRWPRLWLAAAVVGALGFAGASHAGECPTDKRVADGQGQPMGPTTPSGVTDVVRASTDLAKEPLGVQGRQFRLRQLEMRPGGVVPWHSHNDRPAMIYIVAGEVVEYSSSCAVPITHRAGDVAAEKKRHFALVEEHRHEQGRADLGRPLPRCRQDGRAHDVAAPAGGAAPPVSAASPSRVSRSTGAR